MTNRTIVLHIGHPKTGTSAIQGCLHANREELRRQNIYYPLTGQAADHSHSQLALALTQGSDPLAAGDQGETLVAALAAEIESCGCETVVLSSELFLYRLEKMMNASKDLAAILTRYGLRAICFVRRQDSYLESMYRQFIWDPGVRLALDPDAYLSSIYSQGGDYHLVLNAWAGLVGKENISTIVYEQAVRAEGIIRRFCNVAGISTTALRGLDARTNVSIAGRFGTEIMRLVNSYPDLAGQDRLKVARRVVELDRFAATLPIPPPLFSPAQQDAILRRFLESNERLAEEFVRQPLDGYWFPEQPASV